MAATVVVVLIVSLCAGDGLFGQGGMTAAARTYLDRALDLLRQHYIFRDAMHWSVVYAAAERAAPGARTEQDTYPAIQAAIATIGNPHTFLFPASYMAKVDTTEPAAATMPEGRPLEGRLALVRIPGLLANAATEQQYRSLGQQVVRGLAATDPCGWVIDLRGNTGGDMWPMLAVLAPLIGDGQWGTFVDGHGRTLERWGKSGGLMYGDADIPVDTTVKIGTPPIAVLVDSATASSGEATFVSLIGRPATRSFGRPTAGLASGNDVFRLSDGAMLGITTALERDRAGRRYGNVPISPDVITDVAEADAIIWLRQQRGC